MLPLSATDKEKKIPKTLKCKAKMQEPYTRAIKPTYRESHTACTLTQTYTHTQTKVHSGINHWERTI